MGLIQTGNSIFPILGIDPNDVIAENVNKLQKRYPGGEFDAFYSENRKDGDL